MKKIICTLLLCSSIIAVGSAPITEEEQNIKKLCSAIERGEIEQVKDIVNTILSYPNGLRALTTKKVTPCRTYPKVTALTWAILFRKTDIVTILIEAKVEIKTNSEALCLAIQGAATEIVQLLLEAKSEPNRRYSGRSALHQAVEKGREDIVELLVNAKSNLDQREDRDYARAAVHLAVQENKPGILATLLSAKANPSIRARNRLTARGSTALQMATDIHLRGGGGDDYVLSLLLEAKSDPYFTVDAED